MMRGCCCCRRRRRHYCCGCFPLFCPPPPQSASLYFNEGFLRAWNRKRFESHISIDRFIWMKTNAMYLMIISCSLFLCRIYHKSSVTKKTYPNICSCQYSESTIISYCSRSVNLCLHICRYAASSPFLYFALHLHNTNTHTHTNFLLNQVVVAVAFMILVAAAVVATALLHRIAGIFAHGVLTAHSWHHDIFSNHYTQNTQTTHIVNTSFLIRSSDSIAAFFFWFNDILLIISHFNFLCLCAWTRSQWKKQVAQRHRV